METLLQYLLRTRNESKNVLKKMIQNGSIQINGKTITKANYNLPESPIVTIKPSPIVFKNYEFPILYEDHDLIAIEKPSGLLTIATDKEKQKTAYHFVNEYIKKKEHHSIFILHRLDQETSGILLFAKNEKIKKYMQDNWNFIVKKRGYYALVEGIHIPNEGTIHTWLNETKTHFVYSSKDKTGKEAITHYKVIKVYENSTLLDIHLDTGRKNQIRVHMKEMGHPILGDSKYGNKNTFSRLALHAYQLEFKHPKTKKDISIQLEMPEIFKERK